MTDMELEEIRRRLEDANNCAPPVVASDVRVLLAEVYRLRTSVNALVERINGMREPCPNHRSVLCAPDEGCAICANST